MELVIIIALTVAYCVACSLASETAKSNVIYRVDIDAKNVANVINEKFLSVALDAGILCESRAWKSFNTSSPRLLSIAKALSPSFFRLGGTSADYIIFNDTFNARQVPDVVRNPLNGSHCPYNSVITANDWIKLNQFTTQVGWQFLFDFNALLREGKRWNPDNAKALLKFNDKLGYHVEWELGNELNAHHQIEGRQLGKDFVKLRNILNSLNSSISSLLVGPDITDRKFENFLKAFLHEAEWAVNAVTFHHYYFNGRTATLKDFLNVDVFDSLKTVIADVLKVVKKAKPKLKIWLGETSLAWGGGAPGLSDSYVAGFLWLDKLGLSAVHGVDVIIRQSLYHGNYGLITKQLYPLPDYWLSLLYKWLVGRKVLKVTVQPLDRKLRIYSHCVQKGRLYKSSHGVTVFVVNLHNSTTTITIPALSTSPVHQYLLTPPRKMGLRSRIVTLNGYELRMNNSIIPDIIPEIKPPNSSLILPPLTYGFYVFPDLAVPACLVRK